MANIFKLFSLLLLVILVSASAEDGKEVVKSEGDSIGLTPEEGDSIGLIPGLIPEKRCGGRGGRGGFWGGYGGFNGFNGIGSVPANATRYEIFSNGVIVYFDANGNVVGTGTVNNFGWTESMRQVYY